MEEAPENGKESPYFYIPMDSLMSMEEGHELSKYFAHNMRQ
jgi:hypothetical protein